MTLRSNRISALHCLAALFLLTAGLLAGCGGSSVLGHYEVTRVDVDQRHMHVGETTRVEVFFETKSDLIGRPDDVVLVISIQGPAAYVAGSGRIFDNSTSEKDRREPDEVLDCGDGTVYLAYRFDEDELEDREFFSGGFGVRIELSAKAASPQVEVEAAADDDQFFACGAAFDGEENDVFDIEA